MAPAGVTNTTTIYAMSPGQAITGLYDYTTNAGVKQWAEATKTLDDKPYDRSSKGLAHFLSKLSRRARDSGWGNITKTKGHDIFHKYGLFSIQESREDAVLRFQNDAAGNHVVTRDAQASWQMMTCLMNSCAPECLNKVRHSSENHFITSSSGEVSEDGPLFLRILVSRVVVDNRSTISYYSHQLTCLDQLMAKMNNNITNFNDEVQDIVQQLESRGEVVNHLMVNLFKGYEAVADKEFISYIRLKKYEYNEGGSIDADKLMTYAENQFMEMTRGKEWHVPSKENQEILALTAEIKALKERFSNKDKGAVRLDKQAWKRVEPKPDEARTKQVGAKSFNWCIHHKAWCVHKPSECRLGMPTANAVTATSNSNDKDELTLANALAALRMDES